MALLSIWTSNPKAVTSLSIEQIVATAGDGKLRDESDCSSEIRRFFSQVSSEKLAEYCDHCLTKAFPKSGLVLQDLVNELGRRLDYKVANGRYQGTASAVGNDGLWCSPENHDLLVEVKTTDAYRISLDTIAAYRDKLFAARQIETSNSMLIVVGREDTGELEAQIRGSRYAWGMRLISIDALVRLIKIKENTEDPTTGAKIRSLLIPMEYTRVDALIDVLFTAAKDVEAASDLVATGEQVSDDDPRSDLTDPSLLQAKREEILAAFSKQIGAKLIKKSRALYWNAEHDMRIAVTLSKRYVGKGKAPYWYAYHPSWDTFLGDATSSHLILGCMDLSLAFAVSVEELRSRLDELNRTTYDDGTFYWHLKILEGRDGYSLQMPKSGKHLALEKHILRFTER